MPTIDLKVDTWHREGAEATDLTIRGFMKYKCLICGKKVRAKIPVGGDESTLFPYRHKGPSGNACEGHFYEAEPWKDKTKEE